MVVIRPLSQDEAASAFPRRGHLDLSEYIGALQQLTLGEAAEVQLAGHTRRALKRRLGMAAREIGTSLKWARTYDDDDFLIFKITQAAVPNTTHKPTPRRGRPPRVAVSV